MAFASPASWTFTSLAALPHKCRATQPQLLQRSPSVGKQPGQWARAVAADTGGFSALLPSGRAGGGISSSRVGGRVKTALWDQASDLSTARSSLRSVPPSPVPPPLASLALLEALEVEGGEAKRVPPTRTPLQLVRRAVSKKDMHLPGAPDCEEDARAAGVAGVADAVWRERRWEAAERICEEQRSRQRSWLASGEKALQQLRASRHPKPPSAVYMRRVFQQPVQEARRSRRAKAVKPG